MRHDTDRMYANGVSSRQALRLDFKACMRTKVSASQADLLPSLFFKCHACINKQSIQAGHLHLNKFGANHHNLHPADD